MTVTRNLFVRARVADWEKHYIDSKAKEAGISESEFVRRAAMDKDVTVLQEWMSWSGSSATRAII